MLTRRTLQFYASPKLRLIPKPLGGGRGGSKYPWDTIRKLRFIEELRTVDRLRLEEIRPLMKICDMESPFDKARREIMIEINKKLKKIHPDFEAYYRSF